MTKVTKRDNFEAIVKVLEDAGKPDLVEVMKHEIEQLVKKNSYKSTKPTKTQIANEGLKSQILEVLTNAGTPMLSSQVLKALGNEELSPSKVTAMLTQLKNDGYVVRTEEKRKAYFSVA